MSFFNFFLNVYQTRISQNTLRVHIVKIRYNIHSVYTSRKNMYRCRPKRLLTRRRRANKNNSLQRALKIGRDLPLEGTRPIMCEMLTK